MDKEMLKKTFREFKKASGVKFASVNPRNDALFNGEDNGVVVTYFDVYNDEFVYVSHALTPEMAKTFYEVFGKNYNVFPLEYNPYKCFHLYEKGKQVYSLEYSYNGERWDRLGHCFVGKKNAMDAVEDYMDRMSVEDPSVRNIRIRRLF